MKKKEIEEAGEKAERAFEKSKDHMKAHAIYAAIIESARSSASGWEESHAVRDAILKLGRIPSSAVSASAELLKYGEEYEKIAACHSLGELKAYGAVSALIIALEDESQEVQIYAARALKKIEDKDGLIALLLVKQGRRLEAIRQLIEGMKKG